LEEAWLVIVSSPVVPMGSSLLARGLVLGSFDYSTSNTSKFIVIIVLCFMSLLYSLHVGNRVIIHYVSVVLGLGSLVDAPYLAGTVVVAREVTIPLLSS
jgi:hypothetical protein